MNMFIKFWNKTSLIVKIVIGLLIGTVLGLFCPKLTPVAYLGSIFTGALKGIAPVLVLILVSANKFVKIMSMLAHSVGNVMQGNSHVVRELRKA